MKTSDKLSVAFGILFGLAWLGLICAAWPPVGSYLVGGLFGASILLVLMSMGAALAERRAAKREPSDAGGDS